MTTESHVMKVMQNDQDNSWEMTEAMTLFMRPYLEEAKLHNLLSFEAPLIVIDYNFTWYATAHDRCMFVLLQYFLTKNRFSFFKSRTVRPSDWRTVGHL